MGRKKLREPETAMIDAVTHDGRGITATDGKKVFVAGALAGEEVRFIRRKRRRNFDEAELRDGLDHAHGHGCRVFLAINTFARAGDPGPWRQAIDRAAGAAQLSAGQHLGDPLE